MNIVGTSRTFTGKLILSHVMVPDTSEHLPAYYTHWQSQVQKMIDFGNLKEHAYIITMVMLIGYLDSTKIAIIFD